jgi:predicted phage tail protein
MLAISGETFDVTALLNPFTNERVERTVTEGMTIAEIMDCVGADPVLAANAHVYVGEWYVPKERWHSVRPRAGVKVAVRAFIAPHGGGSGGGKDILRTVLIVAVLAAALAFGGPLGASIGLTGALATSVGQAVIGLGGMLLVNALVPPRTNAGNTTGRDYDKASPTKFIEGATNRVAPFEPVDVLFGKRRIYPKLAAQPYTEVIGDQQFLRLLFNWGIGPVSITGFRIGENDIAQYDDVELEHFYGYPADTKPTLFPAIVTQDAFQLTLTQVNGYTIRTSATDTNELGVDLVFPEGLITVADDGTRSKRTVQIKIQYSVANANSWQDIPTTGLKHTFPISWANVSGSSFNQVDFGQKKTQAVRHGLTWKVGGPGQYDVRIKRNTADTTDEQIRDLLVWTALRSFQNVSPVNSPVPVALTAMRIKATDQLNGVIDDFSGIVQRKATHWNGASWVADQETRNPGDMFRFALQGNGLQNPRPDSELDLASIQHFVDVCTTKGFTFDQNRDFTSSLWDLLSDIAAAGRATPTLIDGKYGLALDEAKNPVSMVTPRNSWGFQATKAYVDPPHAFRVQFNNEAKDWRNDEVRVYLPGYTEATATIFETMEFPGVTTATLNVSHMLYQIACAIQRPEQWSWQQEMERLVYRRGDVVYIQHDVLNVGVSSGRIKTLIVDGGGNVTGIVSDEKLTMGGGSYGVVIRNVNATLSRSVVSNPGASTNTLMFTNSIPAASAPYIDDLFSFGFLTLETDKALIIAIEPNESENFSAQITAVPYRTEVYSADAIIPPFDSRITGSIDPVPGVVVTGVRSDETVLSVGAGNSLEVRVNIKVEPLQKMDGRLEVQGRPSETEEPFTEASVAMVSGNEVSISDVRTGEYIDYRLRWVVQGRNPSNWAYVNGHRVIGKTTAPAPLTNMTISTFGGQAFIRWDQPKELDVRFGGTVSFRHSEDLAPNWTNSVSIGNAAQANTLLATLPLKDGAYLARVFDSSGNPSTVSMVDTKQATVLPFGVAVELYESPTFGGTKTNLIATDVGGIRYMFLDGTALWDSIVDLDATTEAIDSLGGVTSAVGTYIFASGFDFGSVVRRRLTTIVGSFNASVSDYINDWGNVDDRPTFDGSDAAQCDLKIYVSQTDDDPASGLAVWSAYERLDSSEVQCRGCRFKAVLTSKNPAFNIYVGSLGIRQDQAL